MMTGMTTPEQEKTRPLKLLPPLSLVPSCVSHQQSFKSVQSPYQINSRQIASSPSGTTDI